MMHEVKFADICGNIKNMNKEQLRTLAQMCEQRIDERQERFEHLCSGFYDYLQAIQDEFPNAKVYLVHGNAHKFDVMDCIIPQNTFECCEIGD
jgi:hypothetical protein